MRYVTIDSPLKPKAISDRYAVASFALNRASSTLMGMMANPNFWQFMEPPAKRIDVIDLSQTFDLGHQAIFSNGQLIGWKTLAVF